MLRVAVIGARRRRQGTGDYVARFLAMHGAEVVAVVGTTTETAAEAVAYLGDRLGISCRGYADLGNMLEAEDLDALAVCSPIPAHREALEAAADRGLHCLCEKPLLADPGHALEADVKEIAGRLAAAGRYLGQVTQWPFTMAGFRRIYPACDSGRARRFGMRLSPSQRGPVMVVDSMSHPISMLRAIAGPCRVTGVEATWEGDEAVTFRFAYGQVEAEVTLRRHTAQPRPASYAIDGLEVRREIGPANYSWILRGADGRSVDLGDPMSDLVADFLDRAGRGEPPDCEGLASDAAAFHELVRAAG